MLAGYFTATGESTGGLLLLKNIKPIFWDYTIFLTMVMLGCTMGGGAILNQIKDTATDRQNQKLFLIGDGFVAKSHAYIESILLIVIGLSLSIYLSWHIFWILLIAIFEAGYLYNFHPFSLKNYPIRGLFANMAMGWFVFIIGWLLLQPFNVAMLIQSTPFALFNTGLYLLTTLPDVPGDAQSGKITFPVRYGIENTFRASLVLFALSLLASILLSNGFMILTLSVSLPAIIWAYFRKTVESAVIALKMGIFFFSIGICVKFPPFFCMILLAFFLTRFYYKSRFGINYPNFKGA